MTGFLKNLERSRRRICQVCGTTCNVQRDQVGPTGWAEAMGKGGLQHDYFYCPHAGKYWHQKALQIVQVVEETPSKRVAALMRQDLVDLLVENGIRVEGI